MMSTNNLVITRTALYELVWSKPMREAAPTLNISDVGLAKICRKLNVPRPPQGYWLKQKERRPKQTPLPPETKGVPTQVVVRSQHPNPQPKPKAMIDIPLSTKTKSHPLVSQCRSMLVGAKTDGFGRLVTERSDIQVSKGTRKRALALLSTLLHTLDGLGCTSDYSSQERAITITVNGETFRVLVFESANRVDHVLTAYEKREAENSLYPWHPKWDYHPSGKLSFSIHARGLYGIQSEWKDRKRRQLEEALPVILNGMYNAAEWLVQKRIKEQQNQRLQAIRYQRQQRVHRARKLTLERKDSLERTIQDWERSKMIRNYLIDVEAASPMITFTPGQRRMHRWAADLARHYDPFDSFALKSLPDPEPKQSESDQVNNHWPWQPSR